jgi:hypothetical protein
MMKMSEILDCDVEQCAHNKDEKCNALAINVGGSGPVCHAFVKAAAKCVQPAVTAGVGACKMKDCEFNDCLSCTASGIDVHWRNGQAICDTYKLR